MIPIRAVALTVLPTSIAPEEYLAHSDIQYIFRASFMALRRVVHIQAWCMNKGVSHVQFFFLIDYN